MDIIGSATSNQLLILMSFPCVGALLLAGFLVFYTRRRRKKDAGMNIGLPPKPIEEKIGQKPSKPSSGRQKPEKAGNLPDEGLNLGILEQFTKITSSEASDTAVDLAGRLDQTAATPESLQQPVPPPAQRPARAELLRLMRDNDTGELLIEIGGDTYRKLTEVTDKKVGQQILALAGHMLAFTNGIIVTDSGRKSVGAPKVSEVPAPLPAQPQASEAHAPPAAPAAEAALLSSLRAGTLTPDEPLVKKRGFLGLGSSQPASEPPLLNLADEINKIVQARLLRSPLGDRHDVSILSDPTGGIRIKVDGRYYKSPEEISNSEVKTLIKLSIKEWERR